LVSISETLFSIIVTFLLILSITSVFGSYQEITSSPSNSSTFGSKPALKPSVKTYLDSSIILPDSSLFAGIKA